MGVPLRVALTGGIATGKSHCLERFQALGAPVIDADVLAREAVAAGSAPLKAVAARFGPSVLQRDGTLDREAVARMVFADPAARRDLEAIVHPFVYARIKAWFGTLGTARVAIADIPLLYETGHASDFDRVVVAACPPEVQLQRLIQRSNLSASEAARRIASQLPIDAKVDLADHVVDTSGTIEETDRQVEDVWRRLTHEG